MSARGRGVCVVATTVVALVALAITVGPETTARAAPQSASGNPSSNLPYTYVNALVAVNAGRARDGVGPISANGFYSLTPAQELFVVVNLERIGRSLPPLEAMTGSLNALSQGAADVSLDPAAPVQTGSPWSYGSVEAGLSDPLRADFGWMYEDGCAVTPPQLTVNGDCLKSPPQPWSHRDVILGDYPAGLGCHLLMGGAQGRTVATITAVFEGYCGAFGPDDVVFTWAQAEQVIGLTAAQPPPPGPSSGCVSPQYKMGYRFVASDGGVFSFGTYPFCGSTGDAGTGHRVVGMASTPDRAGYWLADADGGVYAFGDATFYGSMAGGPLQAPIVGIVAAPFGNGYWLVASDGGVFAFGSSYFYGSMGGTPLNRPIVGMAASPFGNGYWLVASDGGVFAFGSSYFYGSMGASPLNQPIVGIASGPLALGYWLVAADGGVFAFGGARYYGSMGDAAVNHAIVGISS